MIRVCVPIFTAGSLLGVGLGASARDAFAPLAHSRFVLVTLLVGWVVCPGMAWLLLAVVPLDRPYAVGLLVLSLAPAAPFVPAMAQVARSDTGHTAAFMLLATVATVVLLPFGASTFVGGNSPPPLLIARPLIAFVLLPLLAGLAARQVDRTLAERARRPVTVITNVAGASLLTAIVPLHGPGMVSAVGSYAIATQIVFVAGVTLIAYLAATGLPPAAKTVMTIGMCSRNLGAALAPLAMIESDPRAMVMIATAAPITLAGSMVTARWLARKRPATIACLIAVGILSLPATALSQRISPVPLNEPSLRTLFTDLGDDLRRLPSSSTGISIAAGSLLAVAFHPLDDELAAWRPEDGFATGTWIGNPFVLAGSSLALYGIGHWSDERRVTWIAADLLRAQLLSLGITYGVKYAVGRERPDHSSHDSFPSGHSAQTFASATVLVRHLGVAALAPAFGSAAFVALSRLNQNRHHVSDVLFGAGLGIAVGWNASHRAGAWRVAPTLSRSQTSVEFSRVF